MHPRVLGALRVVKDVETGLERLDRIPDPVAQRRALARAAGMLREAADELDQKGYLTE